MAMYEVQRALLKCHTCLFFHVTDESAPDPNDWVGECRCNAPKEKPDPSGFGWDGAALTFGYFTPDNGKWEWPSIQGDGWCGDHHLAVRIKRDGYVLQDTE